MSPDEKSVAVEVPDSQTGAPDIWLIELARGVTTRFTFDPAPDQGAVWSPDGTSIAFSSVRDGTWDLYRKPSNGAGQDEMLLKESENEYVSDWSRDGRFITYDSLNSKGDWDVWVLPLFGDRKPIPFVRTEFNELNSRFSPDGRWISYVSNESGRYEVYVRPFPASDRKWLVSRSAGSGASWRRDGKELFYVAPDAKLMAVAVEADTNFKMSVPKVLFDTRSVNACGYQYAATNDGQRFLVPVQEGASTPFNVVVNWTADLKR
jgi:Tol biopolymer transport system component